MIIKKKKLLQKALSSIREKRQITFIPTMGNFHKGHLSLINYAKKKKDFTVVSIFVNPLQFDDKEDFNLYPRTLKNDIDLLKDIGVDLIYIPQPSMVNNNLSIIKTNLISENLCGLDRPGHFSGVSTIILKFLILIQPDRIILGEKDYQQTLVIKQIIKDFFFPTKVLILPTVRDESGLALSSRNSLIGEKKRLSAKVIFESLNLLAQEIIEDGISISRLHFYKIKILKAGFEKVNYLEILKEKNLLPLDDYPDKARIFISAVIDNVRLIDNISLKKKLKLKKGKIL